MNKFKKLTLLITLLSIVILSGCGVEETPEQISARNKVNQNAKITSVMCAVISRYMADLPEPSVNDYQLAASFYDKAIKTFMDIDQSNYIDAKLKVSMVESKITDKVRYIINKEYISNNIGRYGTAKKVLMEECGGAL